MTEGREVASFETGQGIVPVNQPRVLAYCHDGVGIGHLRRTLNICQNLGSEYHETSFLVATGSPYTSLFSVSDALGSDGCRHAPRVDVLKLPSLSKINNAFYRPKYLAMSEERVLRFRESLLLNATQHFIPDVVLVDKAPVGVCGELVPTLRWLRKNRPNVRIIFGMRDIEDEAATTIRQWSDLEAFQAFEEYYDEVWVYGMQDVFDVAREYQLSPQTQAKLRYTGYLVSKPCDHPVASSDGVPCVLVTVGGGTDGATVLDTYLAESARQVAAHGARSVVVAGPDLPEADARRLGRIASRLPSTEWMAFSPCMMCRIRQADLVVAMGGYNTLCEVALNRKPVLVIPRITPRLEQAMRAALWAQRGVVEVIPPTNLTPAKLAERVNAALKSGVTVTASGLDLDGLDRVRERFQAFWTGEVPLAAAVPM